MSTPRPRQIPKSRTYRDLFGAVVASPGYSFDPERDDLNEGAIEILDCGIRALKCYLDFPSVLYPNKPDFWPPPSVFASTPETGLVKMAEHPLFRRIFNRPFHTYAMTVPTLTGREWWKMEDGIGPQLAEKMSQEFYHLTKHFLKAYDGTRKTFVFSHWEGDNQLKHAGVPVPEFAIRNMIDWLEARQEGVNRARAEIPYPEATDVRVFHTAEANDPFGIVVEQVMPEVGADLASYSSWGAINRFFRQDLGAAVKELHRRIDHMESKLTPMHPSAERGWQQEAGASRVYFGEWGAAERPDSIDDSKAPGETKQGRALLHSAPEILDRCAWAFYWTSYDNEVDPRPATANEHCRGFWMRRFDGSFAPARKIIYRLLGAPTLPPPKDFSAAVAAGSVRLEWSETRGVARLEQQVDDGIWRPWARTHGVSLEDDRVQPGRQYRYRLRIERRDEDSGWFYTDRIAIPEPA